MVDVQWGQEICTREGCVVRLVIHGREEVFPGGPALECSLEDRKCVLENVLTQLLDQARDHKAAQTGQHQASHTRPDTRPAAASSAIPEPEFTQSPNVEGSTETPLLSPKLPAGRLRCPDVTEDGPAKNRFQRAYKAGTAARQKLAGHRTCVPRSPPPTENVENSWIVVLKGKEFEGHSYGVYHTKNKLHDCACCSSKHKSLRWASRVICPVTTEPYTDSVFHGFASQGEVQAYLAGVGFTKHDVPCLRSSNAG